MKKKLFVITLIIAMVFTFAACGGSSEATAPEEPQDSGEASTEMMGESVDLLSCESGALKFVGIQKADPDLTDEEGAYVFVFEFTNYSDEASQCQDFFYIQYYQNGAELRDSISWNSKAQEQYDLINAFFSSALKGGTIQFGQIVLPKDDSSITVMASDRDNSDNNNMIEINLSDGTVSGNEGSEDSDSSEEAVQLALGDKAETDVVEMTLDSFLFGKKLALGSENADNYHMPTDETKGLSAGDGNTYFVFDFTVKNISKESISGEDICGMNTKNMSSLWSLDYNDGYIFDNGDYADLNLVFGGNYVYSPVMDPLATSHFRGIIKCNEEVETNESAPLILHVVLPTSSGTQTFDFKVR